LGGLAFRNITNDLIGVDISENMIKKAYDKDIYNHLFVGDIVEILKSPEVSRSAFELFLCIDVLVYMGECSNLFSALKHVSTVGSILLITTEVSNKNGYMLLKTGRYAHSYAYIASCAADSNFEIISCETNPIRKQAGRIIEGNFFMLRKI
jgi:predicted TPR repeat methyltransferase